ncbi:hypothetical protein SARC_07927, partial [Sphaeroforma arctica JP610]
TQGQHRARKTSTPQRQEKATKDRRAVISDQQTNEEQAGIREYVVNTGLSASSSSASSGATSSDQQPSVQRHLKENSKAVTSDSNQRLPPAKRPRHPSALQQTRGRE